MARRLMLEHSRGETRVREAIIAVESVDMRPVLSDLHPPLGLLWGDRDQLVPFATLNMLRELAPEAAVETIAEAGHVPQVERPRKFTTGVVSLLRQLPEVRS